MRICRSQQNSNGSNIAVHISKHCSLQDQQDQSHSTYDGLDLDGADKAEKAVCTFSPKQTQQLIHEIEQLEWFF